MAGKNDLKRVATSDSENFNLFSADLGTRSPLSSSGLFARVSSSAALYPAMGGSGSSASVNLMTQALLDWEGGRSAERIAHVNPSEEQKAAQREGYDRQKWVKVKDENAMVGQPPPEQLRGPGGLSHPAMPGISALGNVSMGLNSSPRLLDRASNCIFAHTTEPTGSPPGEVEAVAPGSRSNIPGEGIMSPNTSGRTLSPEVKPHHTATLPKALYPTPSVDVIKMSPPTELRDESHLRTDQHHHESRQPSDSMMQTDLRVNMASSETVHHPSKLESGMLLENPAAAAFRQSSDLSTVSLMSDSTAIMLEEHASSTPMVSSGTPGIKANELMGVRSISSISLNPRYDESLGGQSSSHSIKSVAEAACAAAVAANLPSNKHKRERNKTHTPRPSNSFILYRREKHAEIMSQYKGAKALNNNVISKIVATMWRQEEPEVKAKYAAKAEEEKKAHMLKYPDYKYRPRKSPQKVGAKTVGMQKPGNMNPMGAVPLGMGMAEGQNTGYPNRPILLSSATHYPQSPMHYQPNVDMAATTGAWSPQYDARYHHQLQQHHQQLYNGPIHAQPLEQAPSMQLYAGSYDTLGSDDIQLMNNPFFHANAANSTTGGFNQYPAQNHGHHIAQHPEQQNHPSDFNAGSTASGNMVSNSGQRSQHNHNFQNPADLAAAAAAAAAAAVASTGGVHQQGPSSGNLSHPSHQLQHHNTNPTHYSTLPLQSSMHSSGNANAGGNNHASQTNPFSHQRLQPYHGDPTIALPADPATTSSSSSTSLSNAGNHRGKGRQGSSPHSVGIMGGLGGDETDVTATAAMAASYQYSPWGAHSHTPGWEDMALT
ncbi:hypothetical protein HDU97_001022 [Phlyctochytrium planicorne]|nr:hypothetical protein HDU97_001022 [Phlyctochytrium planicorne]